MSRNLTLDLKDGEEELTITLRGKPCRVEDLQVLTFAYLKEQARAQATRSDPPKPCGCKEKRS